MAHTPGPWLVGTNSAKHVGITVWRTNGDDANTGYARICRNVLNFEDAKLIAAAPEMADMLRALHRMFSSPNFTDRGGYADRIAAILAKVDEA